MRILVVTPYLPWPLNAGGNAAQYSTLKCLADDHAYVVVCPLYEAVQLEHLSQLQAALPGVKFTGVPLWQNKVGPREKNPLLRAAQHWIRTLRERRDHKPATVPSLYYPFDPIPVELLKAVSTELARGVDLCQVEFAEMMSLGCWLPADLPKLFIHHQIHFVYAHRFVEAQGDPDGKSRYMAAMMEAQEIGYLGHYQTVITFSREDQVAIQPRLLGVNIVTSPFPVPADLADSTPVPPAFSGIFYFMASGAHNPNRDALEWLLAEIWPRIARQMPAAKLQIIGEWSEADQTNFARPGLIFRGFVKELAPLLQGGIMLVPLRIGSGLRVKILAALTLGVPVVSTTVGAEGLLVTDGRDLLVADSPETFAGAALKLASEPARWSAMAQAGQAAVKQHYSPAAVRTRRNEIYQSMVAANSPAR